MACEWNADFGLGCHQSRSSSPRRTDEKSPLVETLKRSENICSQKVQQPIRFSHSANWNALEMAGDAPFPKNRQNTVHFRKIGNGAPKPSYLSVVNNFLYDCAHAWLREYASHRKSQTQWFAMIKVSGYTQKYELKLSRKCTLKDFLLCQLDFNTILRHKLIVLSDRKKISVFGRIRKINKKKLQRSLISSKKYIYLINLAKNTNKR